MERFKPTVAKVISTPFLWVLLWIVYFFILGLFSLNSSLINVISAITPYNTFLLLIFIPLAYIIACLVVPFAGRKESPRVQRVSRRLEILIYCIATIFILANSFDQQTINLLYGSVPAQYYLWLVFYNCSIILLPLALIFRRRVFIYLLNIIALIGLLFNLTVIKPLHPWPFYVVSIISLLTFFLLVRSKAWRSFT